MSEFKIAKALSDEISDLGASCNALNRGYVEAFNQDVDTLITAKKIIKQHRAINELLELYKVLVTKDINDLNDMIENVERMDETIASSHNT